MVIRIERQHLTRNHRKEQIATVETYMVSREFFPQEDIEKATFVYFYDSGDFRILKNNFGITGVCDHLTINKEMQNSIPESSPF